MRLQRGDAWAELRADGEGGVELEMRDPSHHWVTRIAGEVCTVAGSDWWFLAGPLPAGASKVELARAGERYPAESYAGCWLAALPREVALSRLELVALDAGGGQLTVTDFGTVAAPPPRAAVPRPELDPARAPVTLQSDRRRHSRNAAVSAGFFVVLAAINLALGEPAFAYLALALALGAGAICLLPALPGIFDLRLDHDGFMWRGLLGRAHRFAWKDVADFHPAGTKLSNVGFGMSHAAQGGLSVRARAAFGVAEVLPDTYGLSAVELAALMNAWRERAWTREATG